MDSDARLMEMLQAQAANLSASDVEDEQAILKDEKLSEEEKKATLQKALNMAASNGDVEKVKRLLDGEVKTYIDINASDEDGTPPLIYASCFVCSYRVVCYDSVADLLLRATKLQSKHLSMQEPTSINKIGTNGRL